jgi:hypothetical protein
MKWPKTKHNFHLKLTKKINKNSLTPATIPDELNIPKTLAP